MIERGNGGLIEMDTDFKNYLTDLGFEIVDIDYSEKGYSFKDNLDFSKRLRPYAWEIYKKYLGAVAYVDLQDTDGPPSFLDKYFGIDIVLKFKGGGILTIQEKYRRHGVSKDKFTQKYMNSGKQEGEWFHLGAQLYFYGWVREDEKGFQKWIILDIPKYKMLVQDAGGLNKIGRLRHNGQSSYYSIPLDTLKPAIIREYELTNHCPITKEIIRLNNFLICPVYEEYKKGKSGLICPLSKDQTDRDNPTTCPVFDATLRGKKTNFSRTVTRIFKDYEKGKLPTTFPSIW